MSSILDLSAKQLLYAADLKEKIAALESELAELVALDGGEIPVPFFKAKRGRPPGKKGGMSAEGRARIAAAQRARWATANATKDTAGTEPATKPVKKRKMSAAGRAAIAAGAKARWAKVNAAKGAETKPAAETKSEVKIEKPVKRKMSAAGKAAIAKAAKARWAKVKAAGKTKL